MGEEFNHMYRFTLAISVMLVFFSDKYICNNRFKKTVNNSEILKKKAFSVNNFKTVPDYRGDKKRIQISGLI